MPEDRTVPQFNSLPSVGPADIWAMRGHAVPAGQHMTVISFDIVGNPSPQGSKTRMPNGAIVEGRSTGQRTKHKNWRSAVADKAREVADGNPPLDGTLTLGVTFRFPMPKSRSKTARAIGSAPKTSAPDLDKLLRALCDGLVAGGLLRDDARLFSIVASKYEVVGWTGAEVKLSVP